MKKCARCGKEKPIGDFYIRRETGKPISKCKPCNSTSIVEQQQTRRCREYGISLEEYLQLRLTRKGRLELRRLKGENVTTKVCSKCKREMLRSGFYTRGDGGLISECKECHSCQVVHQNRVRRFASVYGITIQDYDRMLEEQRGVCAICKKPEKNRKLAVDHDHETGRVRGLLCTNCNNTLGWLERNVDAAMKYLGLYYDDPSQIERDSA